MELIQAIQGLELTYRLAIFFGLYFAVWHWNRQWIGIEIERLTGKMYDIASTVNGALIIGSFSMVMIGVIRFGVQVIFGV